MLTFILLFALLGALIVALNFPYDTDLKQRPSGAAAYYGESYATDTESAPTYVAMAREHAAKAGIPDLVSGFLRKYVTERSRVLEVGAGSGFLQDQAADYVGIDLSSTAHRYFNRPFVQADASEIPFETSSFDAAWSIWVLEHVPTPERALEEIRRVVKDGGYILLRPAWNCDPWAADGYEVRPYSKLGWIGKIVKASIPFRSSRWYILLYSRPIKLLRTLAALRGPSRLRYTRLTPNYRDYWVTDSDAVVSLDFHELHLWFRSRGDECLRCPGPASMIFGKPGERMENLMVRVHKPH